MANITTVTRPYAKAVLALAKEQNAYVQWTQMLELLATIVQNPMGKKIITNLAIAPADKAEFICSVAGAALTTDAKNLVKVLARAKRLLILPELFNLYEEMRRKIEGIVIVDLTLAQQTDQQELADFRATCDKNFVGEVVLQAQLDPMLISGGVAQIGNRVVDASVFGRLAAMRNSLRK